MIMQKIAILSISIIGSLLGMSNAVEAMSLFGYSLRINDPIFNSVGGINNAPDFRLENLSTLSQGVQIVDFNLTIGNTFFNYDVAHMANTVSDPEGDLTFTLNTPDLINYGVVSDEIDYDFMGFDPGDIFQFEGDVDRDNQQTVEDYRDILFPNAIVTVGFSNGETLSQILNPTNTNLSSYEFVQTKHTSVPEPTIGLALVSFGLGWKLYSRRSRYKSVNK